MKYAILLVAVIIAIAMTGEVKKPRSSDTPIAPQWNCEKIDTENKRAEEARATGDKCQYLRYIKNVVISQYTIPPYPQCFSQMDGQCANLITDFYEKKNIKTFADSLEIWCGEGAQWEDFVTLLTTFQTKYADAFNTPYWNCVKDKSTAWAAAQYATAPQWPAPFLDVLNYVCQGEAAAMKNVERIAYNQFFTDNGGFKMLTLTGRPMWNDLVNQVAASASLTDTIKQCLQVELGYFSQAAFPEVDGAYNTKENKSDNFEQAYVTLPESADIPTAYNAENEGYECWNYYAPLKHYHLKKDPVNELAFDGNKGHPLCPPNSMYQPITAYGPLCCPIHPVDEKPRTYNCCSNSPTLFQMVVNKKKQVVLMKNTVECYGCTCLQGFVMNTSGDRYDLGAIGSCEAQYSGVPPK